MITVEGIQLSHVTYIGANMRLSDREEFEAGFGQREPVPILVEIAANSIPWSFVAKEDGQPIFMYGVMVSPFMPHLGAAWGYGTDRAWRSIPAVSKHVKQELMPRLLEHGLHRVEVRVLANAKTSIGWLAEKMGAQYETVVFDQGVSRETFEQYSWTRRDYEQG